MSSLARSPRARGHLRARHALAAPALALLLVTTPLVAQPPSGTRVATWAELAAAPGAPAVEVAWLERHLAAAEREELARLVGALTAPAAAQLVAAYLHGDGSVHVPFTEARALADSFAVRPPDGPAGLVRVAYLAGRLRRSTIDGWTRLGGMYAFAFDSARSPARARAATTGASAARRAAAGVHVRLALDFAPAESLLAILGTPDMPASAIALRLASPAFDALLAHHSASFYQLPWTRELMAANLALATSTHAPARLYAFANPKGFLDYADVARHRARYRALIDTLRAREPRLLGDAAAAIASYLPAGTRLERTISVYFADGADGWTANDVAAVDLEWFKDDEARLVNLIAHESFHVAQDRVRRAAAPVARTAADSVLMGALEQLFGEGTANHVAPARAMRDDERAAMVRHGAALLDSVTRALAAGDLGAARALVDRGVMGAGPFYWLGAAMSEAIERAGGRAALAATLPRGGLAFADAYARAVARTSGARSLLGVEATAAVRRLARAS